MKLKESERQRLVDLATVAVMSHAFVVTKTLGEIIYLEAYRIAYDALIGAGVESELSQNIADEVARGYADPD